MSGNRFQIAGPRRMPPASRSAAHRAARLPAVTSGFGIPVPLATRPGANVEELWQPGQDRRRSPAAGRDVGPMARLVSTKLGRGPLPRKGTPSDYAVYRPARPPEN